MRPVENGPSACSKKFWTKVRRAKTKAKQALICDVIALPLTTNQLQLHFGNILLLIERAKTAILSKLSLEREDTASSTRKLPAIRLILAKILGLI